MLSSSREGLLCLKTRGCSGEPRRMASFKFAALVAARARTYHRVTQRPQDLERGSAEKSTSRAFNEGIH